MRFFHSDMIYCVGSFSILWTVFLSSSQLCGLDINKFWLQYSIFFWRFYTATWHVKTWNWLLHSFQVTESCKQKSKYPFEKISGFLCEVGWQAEFALQDLVNGLFTVLTGERWLQSEQTNGGWLKHPKIWFKFDTSPWIKVIQVILLTAPVSMSYIRAPRLHQSTALLWPLLIKISGALQQSNPTNRMHIVTIK